MYMEIHVRIQPVPGRSPTASLDSSSLRRAHDVLLRKLGAPSAGRTGTPQPQLQTTMPQPQPQSTGGGCGGGGSGREAG